MENKYTLEDIGSFIIDYKIVQGPKPSAWMVSIPVIGKRMYQKAALESHKREMFERAYFKALQATPKEQAEFIKQMTPILDDFYSAKTTDVLLGKTLLVNKNTNKR